jgi:hypothetical protein
MRLKPILSFTQQFPFFSKFFQLSGLRVAPASAAKNSRRNALAIGLERRNLGYDGDPEVPNVEGPDAQGSRQWTAKIPQGPDRG